MLKGSKHSAKAKKKLKLAGERRVTSKETKEKQRKAHLGMKYTPMSDEGRENIRIAHLGYIPSEEQKKKISESLKAKNLRRSEEAKQKLSEIHLGELNPQWKGGVTSENRKQRKSKEYEDWRNAIFERDNWICQKTGKRGGILHPHHLNNFADNPELRFDIDNGVTLSEKAHKEFHKKYGTIGTTKKQYDEWISSPLPSGL